MLLRINGGKKWVLTLYVSGTVLIGLALWVFLHLSAGISEDEAGSRVSEFMRTELSLRHMAELQEQKRKIPDLETAGRWQADYNRLKSLQISRIKLKRPLPDIILRPDKPTYVVRVVFNRDGVEQAPRYFWLGWPRFDREVSAFFWYLSF